MKKYSVLVVGNGFDLHMGYKTKYIDFCEYLNKYCKPIGNPLLRFFYNAYRYGYIFTDDWTGFEQLLCHYLDFLNYLFANKNVEFSFEQKAEVFYPTYLAYLTIKDKDIIPVSFKRLLDIDNPLQNIADFFWFENENKKHIMDVRLSSYPDIGKTLRLQLKKPFLVLPSLDDFKREVIKHLDSLLEEVEEELAKYIKSTTSKKHLKTKFFKNHISSELQSVISFNYSHTVTNLLGVQKPNIAYVHGDCDKKVVLGIEEKMVERQTIDETTPMFSTFFKRARRFIKKCNEGFKSKVLDKIRPSSEIAVFGHSLDKSDKSIFEQVFGRDFKHCDIFYYGEERDYRAKFIDLVGMDRAQELNDLDKVSFIKIKSEDESGVNK